MGYQIYRVGPRWGGYGVTAYCEHPGCKKVIDRGVSFACGNEPFSERGCDRYFCSKHLNYVSFDNSTDEKCDHEEDCECEMFQLCARCEYGKSPFRYKREHPHWVWHLLKHWSWEKWRSENPDIVKRLKRLSCTRPKYWDNKKDNDTPNEKTGS